MEIQQIRAKVKSSIWQAVAQSGVNLASVPAEQQSKLVDSIADTLLETINEVMDDAPGAKPRVDALLDGEEQIIWEGRPFLSLVESYVITSERIKTVKGLIGKDIENFELIRVQDVDVSQNLSERIFNIGDITIRGHDPSDPTLELRNIKDPQAVYELLRKAWLAARKKYGL